MSKKSRKSLARSNVADARHTITRSSNRNFSERRSRSDRPISKSRISRSRSRSYKYESRSKKPRSRSRSNSKYNESTSNDRSKYNDTRSTQMSIKTSSDVKRSRSKRSNDSDPGNIKSPIKTSQISTSEAYVMISDLNRYRDERNQAKERQKEAETRCKIYKEEAEKFRAQRDEANKKLTLFQVSANRSTPWRLIALTALANQRTMVQINDTVSSYIASEHKIKDDFKSSSAFFDGLYLTNSRRTTHHELADWSFDRNELTKFDWDKDYVHVTKNGKTEKINKINISDLVT